MSTTITAQEIAQAWLAYITDTFMLDNGCIRPDVEEEYQNLESKDAIKDERELWRSYTDEMIDKILQSSTETRHELLTSIDRKSLAFVQDRIHCGTDLLSGLVQKGLKLNVEGAEALPDFFRQILLQNQV